MPLNVEIPDFHDFSAYVVTSSVAARFFPPQVAGAGATVGADGGHTPFRIDHDEKFNQTTHLQYTIPGSKFFSGLWGGFNWRFDSGLVAGSTPCYNLTDPTAPAPTALRERPSCHAQRPARDAAGGQQHPATTNPVTGPMSTCR